MVAIPIFIGSFFKSDPWEHCHRSFQIYQNNLILIQYDQDDYKTFTDKTLSERIKDNKTLSAAPQSLTMNNGDAYWLEHELNKRTRRKSLP